MIQITNIVQAGDTVTVTAPAHGFATGDVVEYYGVGGLVELAGMTTEITVIDGNTFTFLWSDNDLSPSPNMWTMGGVCRIHAENECGSGKYWFIDEQFTLSMSDPGIGEMLAANLQNSNRGEAYRTGGTSVTATIAYSDWREVSGIAMPDTNFTSESTVRIQAAEGLDVVLPGIPDRSYFEVAPSDYDTDQGHRLDYFVAELPEPILTMGLTITISDPGNPDGYLQFSQLYAGMHNRFAEFGARGVDFGMQVSRLTDTSDVIHTSASGVPFAGAYRSRRRYDMRISLGTSDDVAVLNQFRLGRPVLARIIKQDWAAADADVTVFGYVDSEPTKTFDQGGISASVSIVESYNV